MTRKELHNAILLLVKKEIVDPEKQESLTKGINDLFVKFGKAWLPRNAQNIVYVGSQIALYLPRILRLIVKK